jgi:hypothetical protein
MVLWSDVRTILYRILDDADGISGTYSTAEFAEGLLVWAWNAAQRHFTHHTPRQRTDTLILDGSRKAILPEDFFAVGRLYDPNNDVYWSKMKYQPGGHYTSTVTERTFAVWGNELLLYEDATTTFELWYYAYWPDVVSVAGQTETDGSLVMEQEEILLPVWAEAPVQYLASAFCLLPKAVEAAKVRNWNMSLDSGTPIQNARQDEAWDLYKWYTTLLSSHPALDRGGQA